MRHAPPRLPAARRLGSSVFLARLEQAALRDGQALVGLALRLFEPPDRGARFFPPPIDRVAFLFGLALLARQLLGLLRQPRFLVGRVLKLRVVTDGRLVLLVVLGVERCDCVRGVGDRPFELGGLLRQAHQRVTIRGDPIAELLDLALGLEDAARLGEPAAGNQVRAAEDVAVRRRDRQRGLPARHRRAVVALGDARLADRLANRVRERPVDPHHRRQGGDACRQRPRARAGHGPRSPDRHRR